MVTYARHVCGGFLGPCGITAAERELVIVFLMRYVVWCAKARKIEPLRKTMGLLLRVGQT